MGRTIKPLFNLEPPSSAGEMRTAAVQSVRQVSGPTHPSRANGATCEQTLDEVTASLERPSSNLVPSTPPRGLEAGRAGERTARRLDRA